MLGVPRPKALWRVCGTCKAQALEGRCCMLPCFSTDGRGPNMSGWLLRTVTMNETGDRRMDDFVDG